MEIFKDVEKQEGKYQVSNIGRIKSLERITTVGYGKYVKPETMLIPTKTRNGYCQIGFTNCGKQKFYYVHRLVAETFIPNPENKPQVNHINGDKTDNRVENLEWCTPKENTIHAHKSGFINQKGAKHDRTKLTEEDVKNIRLIFASGGVTYQMLADYYKVSLTPVWNIVNRKSWKHL